MVLWSPIRANGRLTSTARCAFVLQTPILAREPAARSRCIPPAFGAFRHRASNRQRGAFGAPQPDPLARAFPHRPRACLPRGPSLSRGANPARIGCRHVSTWTRPRAIPLPLGTHRPTAHRLDTVGLRCGHDLVLFLTRRRQVDTIGNDRIARTQAYRGAPDRRLQPAARDCSSGEVGSRPSPHVASQTFRGNVDGLSGQA